MMMDYVKDYGNRLRIHGFEIICIERFTLFNAMQLIEFNICINFILN